MELPKIRNDYNCQVHGCTEESGYSIVCPLHRRLLSGWKRAKFYKLWRDIGLDIWHSAGIYTCFHCGKPLSDEESVGDHWPASKGRRKDLAFDLRNFRLSCVACNTSGTKTRKVPTDDDFAPFQ